MAALCIIIGKFTSIYHWFNKIICSSASQNDLCECAITLQHTNALLFGRKRSVISLCVSLFLSRSVCEQSISEQRDGVTMATCKGHLQEVPCERVQNASRIIRLPVMTDNRPLLIRENERDGGWGVGPGRDY